MFQINFITINLYKLKLFLFVFNILLTICNTSERFSKDILNESFLDTIQLIREHKYPAERHYVTTEDGYILQMHRIVKKEAPPVLLMHGLLDSSSTWVVLRPDASLGYYLYDNDYDVWMGNARGNRYSKNHTTLHPYQNLEFWDFSWHEIGYYDLPAMIDYVLNQTGYEKLNYFGHSQGTTSFFVMCSMRPEYNDKISMMHALAPVAFMSHISTPLLPWGQSYAKLSVLKDYEFLPHSYLAWKMCLTNSFVEDYCLAFLYQLIGYDNNSLNRTLLPTILGHLPAGCSFKQIDHYIQLIDSKRFCQYDYGYVKNRQLYGTQKPPEYPLSNITAPIALYFSANDYLSNVIDVERLAKLLPNVYDSHLFPYKQWNHISMLYGINSRKLAHHRMLDNMNRVTHA